MPPDGQGAVRAAISPGSIEVCSATLCLFCTRPVQGGGWGGGEALDFGSKGVVAARLVSCWARNGLLS